MLEYIAVLTFHQFDVIFGQLEGCPLKIHVAWWTREHEAEINVDDMTKHIHQNIVVMPILDIKKILDKAVSCQRLNKIGDGSLPITAEDLFVDISETSFVGHLFEVADGFGVVDELYETWVGTVGNNWVGFHPYFYVLFLEDFVDEGN